ncbi:helix-turn-helix domain protein [Streptomyces violaceusniger Tu 4113]|uniref:Helix-turn-helix domain protein n=2 Tax=Streptomyces violaceusniger TaxID=68280 RepID=G2NTM5_STRV4|nr:helix-turn-helix domain protein [Streptomyces violaceusniger Tu 4113]
MVRVSLREQKLSIRAASRAMNYDHAFLSRVLSGKQRPSAELAASLDALLGADGKLTEKAGELIGNTEECESRNISDSANGGEGAVFRDLKGMAGAPTLGISPFDGMALQESGEHMLKMFLHLDDELGGDSLFLPLSRYVSRMAVNVREKIPSGALIVFGQLNQMVGWLALDANNHAAARNYFNEAVRVGHEADNPGLKASALAYMSLQETYRGRQTPALSFAQEAITLNSHQLTPLIRTMLGTRLARAHACLGNGASCLKALDAARNDFDQVGSLEEPGYVSYVDAIEVAAQEGACYLDLGMSQKAVTSLTSAIGLLSIHAPNRVRDRVHYLSRLAKCYLLDGEVEQACQTGSHALDLSRMIGSARVADRLGEFAVSLAPYSGVSSVIDFREKYRVAAQELAWF